MIQKYFYLICLSLLSFPTFNANAARLSVLFSGSSSGGVTFSGYAGPFDANLGGIKGSNQKCETAFAGSHVCTYEEIVRLGTSYPYSNAVWLVVGAVAAVDGGSYYNATGGATANTGWGTCYAWANAGATVYGFVLATTGSTGVAQCSSTQYLACCK